MRTGYKTILFVGLASTPMIQDIMASIQDPTDFNHLLLDEIAAVSWCAVSASISHLSLAILRIQTPYLPDFILVDSPHSVTPALLDVRLQLPPTFFAETPMGMPQDPFLPFRNTLDSWALHPQTAIAPFENNVRIAPSIPSQPHRIKGFWFHRSPHPNGMVLAGWVRRSSVAHSRIPSSLSLPRCVFSGCVPDEFLIS